MRVKDLRIDDVYSCENTQHKATMMYRGMTEDKYCFIPYNTKKGYYNGAPCFLTESEVSKQVKMGV